MTRTAAVRSAGRAVRRNRRHHVDDRFPGLLRPLSIRSKTAWQCCGYREGVSTVERIDIYPTHEYQGYKIARRQSFPFGATAVPGGVNFSVYSSPCDLLYAGPVRKGRAGAAGRDPFPDEFRIGNVWAMIVFDLDYENTEYGYRMDGPSDPRNGSALRQAKILMDPYARPSAGVTCGANHAGLGRHIPASRAPGFRRFRLGGRPPARDAYGGPGDLRGARAQLHAASLVRRAIPGTFAGMREKIPYLKELGINCLELMPIYEFDEFENSRMHPETGRACC